MADLFKELYLYIFILADDLDTTKSLRSVSKTAWSASYDYFKLLLGEPIIMNFHKLTWYINSTRKEIDLAMSRTYFHGSCKQISNTHKYISFQITAKDLFTSIKTSDNIKNVRFDTYY